MQKIRKMYYDKYLSDMTQEELEQEYMHIEFAIHLLVIAGTLLILGRVL